MADDYTPPPSALPEAPSDDAPGDLPLRVRPPSVLRFNRKAVLAVGGVLAVVLVASFMTGLHGQKPAKTAVYHPPQPGRPNLPSEIVSVPTTYPQLAQQHAAERARAAALAREHKGPKLGAPLAGDTGSLQLAAASTAGPVEPIYSNAGQLTPLQEARQQARLKRIKDAQAARAATVSFGLNTGTRGITATPGSNPGAIPTGGGSRALADALSSLAHPNLGGLTGGQDSVTRQNMQSEKGQFVSASARGTSPYLLSPLIRPASPNQVNAGTIIPAVLITGVNSDLPGQLIGQVSESVYDSVTGNTLLIPQGTRLIGVYDSQVAYGQTRVLVVWQRLIFPNGDSINLQGMPGVDLSGYSGFHDLVNNHWMKLVGGVILGSVLGAAAQMAQGPNYNAASPSFSQLATQGVAQNLNQVGQKITQKNLDIQPTLEIRPGYRFNVMVTKDMILRPYHAPMR